MFKKKYYICMIALVLLFPLANAASDLRVSKETVRETIIPGLNEPAIFELTITNYGESDEFKIHSHVISQIKPDRYYSIDSGEEKIIEIEAWLSSARLRKEGSHSLKFEVRGRETESIEGSLLIRVTPLGNALNIYSEDILLGSEETTIYIENRRDYNFKDLEVEAYSEFFHLDKEISIGAGETMSFEVVLDEDKVKSLPSNDYKLETDLKIKDVQDSTESYFKYKEEADVYTSEIQEGAFISSHEIIKENRGNVPTIVQARIEKNILSRFFTYFNNEPSSVTREGAIITYTFNEEIDPGEEYIVSATTNWVYPLLLLIAIVIIIWLIMLYTKTDLVLNKKTNYVKTKSGKFALKVSISVKAKNYVEKINIIDKIPSLAKVHKRFGANEPDKIDEKNRRLEWNLDSLQKGEVRLFSYIIFSDVAPVGKFELPTATAVYEKEGKIEESKSNKVFFVTENENKKTSS